MSLPPPDAMNPADSDEGTPVSVKIRERVRAINARPAAADQCLDDDGLRTLGAAIDNGAPPAAGSGGPVPAAGPAD